jgi:membrane protease subunit HflK
MYLDAMQQIYSNVTKVMVDSRQGSNLLYLPLDKIMQMSAQGADVSAVAVTPTPALPAAAPASPVPTPDARLRDAARTRERDTR